MIDYFALALTHGLLGIAFWRLLRRDDLDAEGPRGADPAPLTDKPPVGPVADDRFRLRGRTPRA